MHLWSRLVDVFHMYNPLNDRRSRGKVVMAVRAIALYTHSIPFGHLFIVLCLQRFSLFPFRWNGNSNKSDFDR